MISFINTLRRLQMPLAAVLALVGITLFAQSFAQSNPAQTKTPAEASQKSPASASTKSAIFAGGCFWCTESDFEKFPGVISAESGYLGGKSANPTYDQVSRGGTGHIEAVKVVYDSSKVSYSQLLEYFWRTIDPTVKDQQFCDRGSQYRSAIFYDTPEQKQLIEASRDAILKAGRIKVIYTEILPASAFYLAEAYHQDYYKKNPIRYNYYRTGCGRDARLAQVWGN